jgi:hypothetical protein
MNTTNPGSAGPAVTAAAVTAHDANDLAFTSRALWIGASGDLKVTMASGADVTFEGLGPGWHPIQVRRVWATGTTASKIVAVA